MCAKFMLVCLLVSTTTAQLYSVENPDGSYSLGHSSNSEGSAADSFWALFPKAAGWTGNPQNSHTDTESSPEPVEMNLLPDSGEIVQEKQTSLDTSFSIQKDVPYLEILKLLESFLRLKGEVASRIHNVILDNADLIKAVHHTVLNKIANLHNFTLTGVVILRKVLEFASSLFGHWSVNLGVNKQPSSYGYSYGSPVEDYRSVFLTR